MLCEFANEVVHMSFDDLGGLHIGLKNSPEIIGRCHDKIEKKGVVYEF